MTPMCSFSGAVNKGPCLRNRSFFHATACSEGEKGEGRKGSEIQVRKTEGESCLLAAAIQSNAEGESSLWWLRLLHVMEVAPKCPTSVTDMGELETWHGKRTGVIGC